MLDIEKDLSFACRAKIGCRVKMSLKRYKDIRRRSLCFLFYAYLYLTNCIQCSFTKEAVDLEECGSVE